MIVPLAVSGLIVISVVIVAALGLLYVLMRGEAGYEGDNQDGGERADGAHAAGEDADGEDADGEHADAPPDSRR